MKKTLLVLFVTFFATMSFAQQQLATLNHNDNITVYYGQNALQQAHAAAVNGDIITLSPGLFEISTITKAITIRGTGMFQNNSLGVEPTYLNLNSSLFLNIPSDTNHYLVIEGVHFRSSVFFNHVSNPRFIKCKFSSSFSNSTSNPSMDGAMFINCILHSFYCNNSTNTTFINSVILLLDNGPANLMNCIAGIDHNSLSQKMIQNSILYSMLNVTPSLLNGNGCYNSIGINTYSSYSTYFNLTNMAGHALYNKNSFNTVFKHFNRTSDNLNGYTNYYDGISFELQDDIVSSILGDDSTQVGIYGGAYPFDPIVRNPKIHRCNVSNRSTSDGKLAVDIEVVADEE